MHNNINPPYTNLKVEGGFSMSTKVCVNCKQVFSGEDNICQNCKFIKEKKVEQMANFVGAMEMLAVLRGAKDEGETKNYQ